MRKHTGKLFHLGAWDAETHDYYQREEADAAIAAKDVRIKDLEKVLHKYAKHMDFCEMWDATSADARCTCGLNSFL